MTPILFYYFITENTSHLTPKQVYFIDEASFNLKLLKPHTYILYIYTNIHMYINIYYLLLILLI